MLSSLACRRITTQFKPDAVALSRQSEQSVVAIARDTRQLSRMIHPIYQEARGAPERVRIFYNRLRKHSNLGYLSPEKYIHVQTKNAA